MRFSYEAYMGMLEKLIKADYHFSDYKNWMGAEKTVILRHDVDFSLKKAVLLSEIESNIFGETMGGATYFVMVSTNFYNIFSKESKECIRCIMKNGGNIGLHFDETQYDDSEDVKNVYKEIEILSDVVGLKVDVVSMHRPSEKFLSSDIKFHNIINAYGDIYYMQMKYLSDSRMQWREDVNEAIESKKYQRLHILTHPCWYMHGGGKSLKYMLKDAILNASLDYYDNLNKNFRDLQREVKRTEIGRILYR